MLQPRGDESITSRTEMDSPCQPTETSLEAPIQEYSGPNLPKEIWGYIHSLLPMRDAAQVACVSPDFVHSWRSRPNLIFNGETLGLDQSTCQKDNIMRDFTDRVDNILKKHSGVVKTLNFWFGQAYRKKDHCYLDHLDDWLQGAVKPGIEELQLKLLTPIARYNFPCSLLSGGVATSLRSLSLGSCVFQPTAISGCLRSLTKLELRGVCIEEDQLWWFLSSTPALESLDVRCCYPITVLRIPCLQQLSYLGISCREKYKMQSIHSKALNLSSFYFQDDIRFLLLLGDTLLRIKKLHMVCEDVALCALSELTSSIPSLETLTVDYSHEKEAIKPMVTGKFIHLRSLSIRTSGSASHLLSLANFLHVAPSLETLLLSVGCVENDSILEDPSGPRIMPGNHHEKLKSVQILSFCCDKYIVGFTCHILESAVSLKRLTLDTTYGLPRCSVSETGKCWSMSTRSMVRARTAVLAVERYIKPKVASNVELNVLEPCSRCYAAELLIAGYHNDSTYCSGF